MQRWQLTTGLALGAIGAILITPAILRTVTPDTALTSTPPPTPTVVENIDVAPAPVAAVGPDTVTVGRIKMTTALDVGAQLLSSSEERFVVLNLDAEDVKGVTRQPVHLAVVMDNSGSMDGRGKIVNARHAASTLAQQLGPDDTLSLVTFSDRATTLIYHGTVSDQVRMQALIKSIDPGGGTNLSAGLLEGQQLLQQVTEEGVKRLIVLSDGIANLGITDDAELAGLASSLVTEGITVSSLGLGLDFNEDLLAAMGDRGGGHYHFVDQPGQLAEMFTAELNQMGAVVGRQIAVDVNLADGVELLEVYGYDSAETSDGYRVFVGDMPSGASRKIVARVRVDARQSGALEVAAATLAFTEPESGAPLQGSAVAGLMVTEDLRVIRGAVNAAAGQDAAMAAAAVMLERSARAFDDGDTRKSAAELDAGSQLLRDLSSRYNVPGLRDIAEEFTVTKTEFESATDQEGQYQIKKVKERARDYSH